MASITTRETAGTGATIKGSPLTNTELDNNFININTQLVNISNRVSSATSVTSPLAWNSDSYNHYLITAQSSDLTISADSGTPSAGDKAIFYIKDNGTARTLTWTTGTSKSFRAIGISLPTTTVISKVLYVGCIYNSSDSRWDVVAVAKET